MCLGVNRNLDSSKNQLVENKFLILGLGPVLHFDHNILEIRHFSFGAETSGGFVVYNKRFPPQGDIYNIMFRVGVYFGYNLTNSTSLKVAIKWMHVSNGQGTGPQNPYYEGYGFGLTLSKIFYSKK